MKKRVIPLLFTLLVVSFFVAYGTKNMKEEKFTGFDPSSEVIEVFKPGEIEPFDIISYAEEVKEFFSDLNFDDWEMSSVSDGTEEAVIYKFYDRETAKFGEKIEDKELYHSGTMMVYADEPKVKFKTKLFSVSLEVPAEDHKKLFQ